MSQGGSTSAVTNLKQDFLLTETLNFFDAAAAALRAYDTETNGAGKMLLLWDRFPDSVDSTKKIEMFKISGIIHNSIKAHSFLVWHEWYYGSHKTLDEALNAARELLSKPSPNHGPISEVTRSVLQERAARYLEHIAPPSPPEHK